MSAVAMILSGLRLLVPTPGVRAAPMATRPVGAPPAVPEDPLAPGPLPRRTLVALGVLCAILFTLRLSGPFLHEDSEARYATVVREMAQTGQWFSPQFQGRPVHKPPLVFWLMGASRAVVGDGEIAARLPSALAGVAAVLVTASLGARLFGPLPGFLSGLLLATMFHFIWVARRGQMDMPLTAFVVGAQALLFRSLHEGRARLWAGGYACVALGAMAKGLAGVALPLGTAGIYALLAGRGRELLRRRAMVAAAGPAAALGIYYAALGPGFLRSFLLEDHVRRFVAGVDVVEPFWWYGPELVVAVLPYAGWLPFAAAGVFSDRRRDPHGPAPAAAWWRGPGAFAMCWFAFWFIVISISRGKQEQYVVPLLPPLAMAMAAGLVRATARAPGWWARAGIAAAPASVAVGSAIFIGYLARKALLTAWPAAAFALLALVGVAAAWGAFRWPMPRAVGAAVFAGALTSLAVITAALPPLERARAAAPVAAARAIREAAGGGPIVSYGERYTPTPRVTFYLNLPQPLRHLETPDELDAFLREDRTSYLLLQRPAWEVLQRSRPLGRSVTAQVPAGRADYILLGPPPR